MSVDYRRYLHGEVWQKRRKRALDRAGRSCEMCKAVGPLHVHHVEYDRLGRELPGDLIVLCPDCHEHAHRDDLFRLQVSAMAGLHGVIDA
jgi:5-methylcytosine-specific restriction endonuclease McrA